MPLRNKSKRSKVSRRTAKPGVSKAIRKYVKTVMPKPEVKMATLAVDEAAYSDLAQFYVHPLYVLYQGVTSTTRIGREIKATGVWMNCIMHNNNNNMHYMRELLVDMGLSTLTVATEFWRGISDSTPLQLSSQTGLNAIYALVDKTRVKVLHDKVHKFGSTGPPANQTQTKHIRWFKKLNHKIKYDENDVGGNNQTRNIIYVQIHAMANDDTGLGEAVEASFQLRQYYVDS